MGTAFIVSTPISPLGHPFAGGVTQMIADIAAALSKIYSAVCIVAPDQSVLSFLPSNARIKHISGKLVLSAVSPSPTPVNSSVLDGMLSYVEDNAGTNDIIINISYDAEAFTRLYKLEKCRVLHYVSSAIESEETTQAIQRQFEVLPDSIACLSHSQARYFGIERARIIPLGIDALKHPFNPHPQNMLCWAGRISEEKSPRTAFQVARELGLPLRILGAIQSHDLWNDCLNEYPEVALDYTGHLAFESLVNKISECAVFMMTTNSNKRFLEAFGIVVIEALASGVPVVTRRGHGPAELIENDVSGVFVEDEEWADAVRRAMTLDRAACRQYVAEHYSKAIF